AFGIAECLSAGADVVVTGRVTDASLVVGPAIDRYRWGRTDYDALAGATVAGHILECGAQATGGNFAFFTELADVHHPGFPIAEVAADGSCVVTKHPGTGGAATVQTVTAQLLYELGPPGYLGPDVVAHFDTIALADAGPDRVAVSGVRGSPPPPTLKVGTNTLGGYRNTMTFVLTGLDIEAKARLVREQLTDAVGRAGRDPGAAADRAGGTVTAPRTAGARTGGRHLPRATGYRRRRALRRQGRRRERRRVGAGRARVRVAARVPDRRRTAQAAARGGRPGHRPVRAAEPV